MKKVFTLLAIQLSAFALMAQSPAMLWTSQPAHDNLNSTFRLILPLAEGGYLAAGDKGVAVNGRHPWVLRLNAAGTITKEYTLTGETVDRVLDAALLPDDRVVLACSTGTALEMIVITSEGLTGARWQVKPLEQLANQVEWVDFLLVDNRTVMIGYNQWREDLPSSREFIGLTFDLETGTQQSTPDRFPGRALAALVSPYGSFHVVMQKQEGPGIEMYSTYPALGVEHRGMGGSADKAIMTYLPNDRLLVAVQGESRAGEHPISVYSIDPRDNDNQKTLLNWTRPPQGTEITGFGGYMMPLPLIVSQSNALGQAVFSAVPLNNAEIKTTPLTSGIFYPQAVCSNLKGELIIAGFSRRSVADVPEIHCQSRP